MLSHEIWKYVKIDDGNNNFVSIMSFQKCMEFVDKFKQAWVKKGLKQMD